MTTGMFNKKAGIFENLLTICPLTYNGILTRTVDPSYKTILDVGCGTGIPMEVINANKKFDVTGVDLYTPYLKECAKKKIYKKLIKADVRKLPFKDKSFDAVICFHVIEHLTKKEGFLLLKKLEKIAKHRVIVAMPVGHLHQEEYDGNEHQAHKSEWYPKDLRKLGYTVVGQGLRAMYGETNVVLKFGKFSYVLFFVSMLFQPLLFLRPELAVYMIAKKEVGK